jgi:hypothetical protein
MSPVMLRLKLLEIVAGVSSDMPNMLDNADMALD